MNIGELTRNFSQIKFERETDDMTDQSLYRLSLSERNYMKEYDDRLEWLHYVNKNRKFIRLLRSIMGYKNIRSKQIYQNREIPPTTLSKILNEQEHLLSKKTYVKYITKIIDNIKPKQFLNEIIKDFDIVDKDLQKEMDKIERMKREASKLSRKYNKFHDL